jgi:mRNA interferase MazF
VQYKKREIQFKKYDVLYANFDGNIGSEQGGVRPAIVIQNNVGNKYSPTLMVLKMTSEYKKEDLPTHLLIEANRDNGLKLDSMLLAEQIMTIDKSRVIDKVGSITDREIQREVFKRFLVSATYGYGDLDGNALVYNEDANTVA